MTSKDEHQKHVPLSKPNMGEFGRNELAFLGAPCGLIQELARDLIAHLSGDFSIAYVDADHHSAGIEDGNGEGTGKSSNPMGMIHMVSKKEFTRFDTYHPLSVLDKRTLFNQEDLVFINGNHFEAKAQILIIDPKKNLEKKLARLTDVKLILLKDDEVNFPDFLKEHLKDWQAIPVFYLEDIERILLWIKDWMGQNIPAIKGLVLAGGESKRMRKDKGELAYHGVSQREHLLSLMKPFCTESFLSCNAKQAYDLKDEFPLIVDKFLDLGPMGGILSAFRSDPTVAWLTLACDLPFLSQKTLTFLLAHRNPSKVATAFMDPKGEFPEPLVTIWEPKSYSICLQYLSQGFSCPRKVLINSEVEILKAPFQEEFHNVNRPEEYEEVIKEMMMKQRK